jgi:hypothetical protein
MIHLKKILMHFNRCIPYRWRKENADQIGKTEEMIEVLMISSPKRDDLVFPKVLDIVCTNNFHQHANFNTEKVTVSNL